MSIWVILAIVATLGELYFFFMQRSALEVCRVRDLPHGARFFLMPGYYRVAWGFIIVKWVALIALLINGQWWMAILIFVVSFIVSSAAPVPHAAFFEIFYRELDEGTTAVDDELRGLLRAALESVDREYHVTRRFTNH